MPVHTIHKYWGANILFNAIALVLDGRESQVHAPAAFTPPGKGPQYVLKEVSGWAPEKTQTPWRLAILFFLLGIEA